MKYKTVEFLPAVVVTPRCILMFIVSFCGNNVFPNLSAGLQILLTVAISVAGCERSFSKMELTVTYISGHL